MKINTYIPIDIPNSYVKFDREKLKMFYDTVAIATGWPGTWSTIEAGMCRHQFALKYHVDIIAQPTKYKEATQLLWTYMFAMGTTVHCDVIDNVKTFLCTW